MNQVPSIACPLPFCHTSQEKQTNFSIGFRITTVALGIITAIISVLILLNVPVIGQLGTTAGWATFSVGAFITLVGTSIKCTKKSQDRIRHSPLNVKPFVVPTFIESQEVPEEVVNHFRKLKEGSTVWVGAEKKAITIGECIGSGGSKRAMEISENEVLMLPNFFTGFYVWRRMVDEEVQISDRLTEFGILTVQSKRVDLYLSEDSEQALPAYICPSFRGLANKGMYVIDSKSSANSWWKARSYFKGDEDRYAVDSWLPIVKPLLQDIYILAKNNCLFGGDTLNIAIIKSEQGYIARYFAFDFSSKNGPSNDLHCIKEDVIDEIVEFLPYALKKVFREQYDCDTGRENWGPLGEEYTRLIKDFQKECPKILKEMQK